MTLWMRRFVSIGLVGLLPLLAGCPNSGGGALSGSVSKAWGTVQLIETDNAGDIDAPQVAMDDSGNALAVWMQGDGTRASIVANRYVAATDSWGTAQLIETDNAGHAGVAQVAVDGSGNAVAVWQQSDGTRANIWTNRYVAGSGWGTAQLIETDNAGGALVPQMAVDMLWRYGVSTMGLAAISGRTTIGSECESDAMVVVRS